MAKRATGSLFRLVCSGQRTPQVYHRAVLRFSTQQAPDPKPQSKPDVQIRTLRKHEVPRLNTLWADAGINIGDDHMDSVLTHLAPEGYLVAVSEGRILGSCVQVCINDDIGLQGGLIADPATQGLGIARHVRFAGNKVLGHRNIAADAVPHMADTYERWGYKYRDYESVCYGGALRKDGLLSRPAPSLPDGCTLMSHQEVDFRDIMAFDRTIHPEGSVRTAYMKWLVERPSTHGYVVMDDNQSVRGIALSTNMPQDHVLLGPLYAEDPTIAEVLFRALVADTPEGTECETIAPVQNEHALGLFRQVGLEEFARALRMYTDGIVPMPTERLFGSTMAGYAGFLLC